jgi:hypothetical protein
MKKTMKDRRYGGENVMPVKAGGHNRAKLIGASVMPVKAGGQHNPSSFRCLTRQSRPRKESFAGIHGGLISILLLLGSAGAHAADQVYVCTPCPAGKYSDGTMTECAQCPSGKYCPVGSSSPQTCPAGQVPNSARTACASCGAGTYYSGGSCTTCPSNASCPTGASTFTCNTDYHKNSAGTGCFKCITRQQNKVKPSETSYTYNFITCKAEGDSCVWSECGTYNLGYGVNGRAAYCSSYPNPSLIRPGAEAWCRRGGSN